MTALAPLLAAVALAACVCGRGVPVPAQHRGPQEPALAIKDVTTGNHTPTPPPTTTQPPGNLTTTPGNLTTTTLQPTTTHSPGNNTTDWPTLSPPVPSAVHTPVTIVICVIFTGMTLLLMYQVYLVWRYGHKKVSYFNACLSMSLLWSLLRLGLLYAYAIANHIAGEVTLVGYLALFALPTSLQFATFSLIVLYFEVTLVMNTMDTAVQRRRRFLYQVMYVLANVAFNAANIVCAIVNNTKEYNKSDNSVIMKIRVIVSETFTLVSILLLAHAVWSIHKKITARGMIQGQGVSSKSMLYFAGGLVLLFLSRFVYNMVAITNINVDLWGYRWTFLTDQADRRDDDGWSFVFFVGALFVWEVMPVFLVVWFFWVPKNRSYIKAREAVDNDRRPLNPTAVSFEKEDSSEDEFSISPVNSGHNLYSTASYDINSAGGSYTGRSLPGTYRSGLSYGSVISGNTTLQR